MNRGSSHGWQGIYFLKFRLQNWPSSISFVCFSFVFQSDGDIGGGRCNSPLAILAYENDLCNPDVRVYRDTLSQALLISTVHVLFSSFFLF